MASGDISTQSAFIHAKTEASIKTFLDLGNLPLVTDIPAVVITPNNRGWLITTIRREI